MMGPCRTRTCTDDEHSDEGEDLRSTGQHVDAMILARAEARGRRAQPVVVGGVPCRGAEDAMLREMRPDSRIVHTPA